METIVFSLLAARKIGVIFGAQKWGPRFWSSVKPCAWHVCWARHSCYIEVPPVNSGPTHCNSLAAKQADIPQRGRSQSTPTTRHWPITCFIHEHHTVLYSDYSPHVPKELCGGGPTQRARPAARTFLPYIRNNQLAAQPLLDNAGQRLRQVEHEKTSAQTRSPEATITCAKPSAFFQFRTRQ